VSSHFQKLYISCSEFVDSWDKELYELTNLDYLLFILINHLGNRVDKQFFVNDRRLSSLFLNFDQIGTLCFNIGDSLGYFLEDNCFGKCPLNCPKDLNSTLDLRDKKFIKNDLNEKLNILRNLLPDKIEKEQFMRFDLLNYVLMDTIVQFYSEEFNLEVNEEDMDLIDLTEFLENNIIDFFQIEGQELLSRPFETAINNFEDLLENETSEHIENLWTNEEPNWKDSGEIKNWDNQKDTVSNVFSKFLSNDKYAHNTSNNALVYEIQYLNKYLVEYVKIEQISEFSEFHLGEFFSVWLVRELIMSNDEQISFIFKAVARFITFLHQHYHINLKHNFLKLYNKLKTDLPRVIQATNTYISEYNLFDAILSAQDQKYERILGFFEIKEIFDPDLRLIRIVERNSSNIDYIIHFDSSAFPKLRKGDILHTSIYKRDNQWQILEIQYIYTNLAKIYI
jgi:hypothetical protein